MRAGQSKYGIRTAAKNIWEDLFFQTFVRKLVFVAYVISLVATMFYAYFFGGDILGLIFVYLYSWIALCIVIGFLAIPCSILYGMKRSF